MSEFLAQAFSLYFVVMGLAVLINRGEWLSIIDQFFENKAVLLFSGVFTLILGILLVLSHNIWVMDWRVIITFFSWTTFIKGVGLLVFPEKWFAMSKSLLNESFLTYWGGAVMVIGGILGYYGFCAG